MIDVAIPTDEIVDPPARLGRPRFPWWNRDQCRTPMPWTAGPGAGFTTGRPWIRIGEESPSATSRSRRPTRARFSRATGASSGHGEPGRRRLPAGHVRLGARRSA